MTKKLPRESDRIYPALGYAEIGLTQGHLTKVSLIDYENLKKYDWLIHISVQKRAVRREGKITHYLHHEVLSLMGLKLEFTWQETDHINQDTLDNRRENLRIVSHNENMLNTKRHKERLGFMFHKPSSRWFSYVNYPGKVVSLGYWDSKAKAQEIAKIGQELQEKCSTALIFKVEWKKLGLWKPAPGKRRV